MTLPTDPHRNIADSLAELLPKPELMLVAAADSDQIQHVAVPKGFELKTIDSEHLLPNPRRTSAKAELREGDSFIAYVQRHAGPACVVWCAFNPQTFALKFTAVIDEHAKGLAGWRKHSATYEPSKSHEWNVWTGNNGNGKAQAQVAFAEFLERNDGDIASIEGLPSSLDMMKLATEFEANGERKVKSVVRLQGGGSRVDFVDDDTDATIAQMRLFERFAVGIPVFWAGPAYRIDARLKYRHASGKVNFWYELIRPDRVHEAAARELIEKVRAGIGATPLLMGECQ